MTLFGIASLFVIMAGLAALPSSSVLLVVAESASKGVKNGIMAALGVVTGDLVFLALAILGMTAMATQLGSFFVVIKVLAGAYLIWIGISLLRSLGGKSGSSPEIASSHLFGSSPITSFFAGLFLTLGDLKAIFFYASLVPSFMDLASLSSFDVTWIVAVTIVAVGGVKVCYAIGAQRATRLARGVPFQRGIKGVAGCSMIGAGAYVILRD